MTKRELVFQASQKLFSQFGLKKVTMDEIANEAGVSKATAYKYFSNKHEVFREVVEYEGDLMLERIESGVKVVDSAEEKLTKLLKTKIENIHHLINFYRVTQESWSDHWPYIKEVHDRFMREEKRILASILEEGNMTGELNVQNLPLHTHILMISLKSIEYPWAIEDTDATLDEIIQLIVRTFLYGAGNHRKA